MNDTFIIPGALLDPGPESGFCESPRGPVKQGNGGYMGVIAPAVHQPKVVREERAC
jgi:hypothetical protein